MGIYHFMGLRQRVNTSGNYFYGPLSIAMLNNQPECIWKYPNQWFFSYGNFTMTGDKWEVFSGTSNRGWWFVIEVRRDSPWVPWVDPKTPEIWWFVMVYPLVMTNTVIENGPVEIVDLPLKWWFSSSRSELVYQRVKPLVFRESTLGWATAEVLEEFSLQTRTSLQVENPHSQLFIVMVLWYEHI